MATPQAIMTVADLARAVTEITQQSGQAVATGDEIYVWLAANNIDWGGNMTPRGRHFWKADHANAPGSLRKFKIEPLTHTGANAWCLARRWVDGCVWTTQQAPRWRAIPWDATKKNWIWRCAERVDATVEPFNVFDVQALARCKAAGQEGLDDEKDE
jgi:hypothetical protein